jgi:hypothetical protein
MHCIGTRGHLAYKTKQRIDPATLEVSSTDASHRFEGHLASKLTHGALRFCDLGSWSVKISTFQ